MQVSTPWKRKSKFNLKTELLCIVFLILMDFYLERTLPSLWFRFDLLPTCEFKFKKYPSIFDPEVPKIDRNYTFFGNFSVSTFSNKCELCNFRVRNVQYADSSSRDLLLLIGVDAVQNLVPLMRSLRTTNSRCSVAIFIDDDAKIDKSTLNAVTNCGLHIFRCARFKTRTAFPCSSDNYIFFYIKAFLKQNAGKFDRVIISDSYDIVFQGDPFNIQVTRNAISGYRSTNYKSYIGQFDESNTEAFEWPLYFICGIYFGGSEHHVYNLVKIITEYIKLPPSVQDATDFYKYFDAKCKEKFIIQSPIFKSEFVYSPIKGVVRKGAPNAKKSILRKSLMQKAPLLGRIKTEADPNSYASVIRTISHSQYLMGSVLKSCPRLDAKQENYLSYLDESWVIDLGNKFIIADLDN